MNRPRTLAIVLLAALPTPALAQSAREVLDAHAKTSSTPTTGSSSFGRSYNDTFTGDFLNDWNIYSQAGWRAIRKGYYETAEHEFLSAIKAAKRAGGTDARLIARSYADYAWALQKQGKSAQAEPLLKWVLIAREASFEPTAAPIPQTLNQLATVYYDLGRYADAEPLLRRAIEVQAKSPKASPLEIARSESLMGLELAAQRRYAESEPHFARAATLREKSQGPSHPDTGDALSNLAWTYHEQGKDDEAKPLFDRALRIFERSRGESDPSVAHVLDGLGQILSRQGKADEAEADFLRAIAIWERYPNEGLTLLEVLRHYANLLEASGRMDDFGKIKGRIDPLRARYTMPRPRLGAWYRIPDHPSGYTGPAPAMRTGGSSPAIPG